MWINRETIYLTDHAAKKIIQLSTQKYGIPEKNETVVDLLVKPTVSSKKVIGFPYNGKTIEKAIFVIKEANRFLVKREIYERVDEIQNTDNFRDEISMELGLVAKDSNNPYRLTKKQLTSSLNNTVWGLIDWLDVDGKIKRQHVYETKSLPYRISIEDEKKNVAAK